ncbi:tRNA (adenine(22)-N(1))-methyltransferase [Macrococcus equipercicus]|uniref:tRNA (Adenine-N(1))-methyltransferase n=1 Tax=Macrococcus equipercicus TaxID=69967 RepID=A0A9Q9BRU9_9STAP|nr:tRNA (adenine(22)-N(1))-methyltransferase TrmK [Macrococcus equipercicus]KAA1040082.1 tRNA (adenine-N(1))-methyltransferase [Macrococcus equipercicus]UTH12969.1 tRNA (adenine-N(1))-methyltransferase [Macrococcus equipercicus]
MLSKRLEQVAAYVTGTTMADIGSDHAYLPIALVADGKVTSAVAGEVVDGPFQAAVNNVRAHGLTHKIAVRKGSGLEVIADGEVDSITICGMGGPLIADILLSGMNKLNSAPRLILQSNIHTASVRAALIKLGYTITAEEIIKEKRHIYEIVVADKQQPMTLTAAELKFGPLLMAERSPLFLEKWTREYNHLQRVKESIKDNPEQTERLKEIEQQLIMFKEVIG